MQIRVFDVKTYQKRWECSVGNMSDMSVSDKAKAFCHVRMQMSSI